MNMQYLRRGMTARSVTHRKVGSSLVRRLVQAQDDPGKRRIRAWLRDLNDEQVSRLGLTSDDIAVLRGTQTPGSSDASDTAPNLEAETTESPVRFHNSVDYRGLTPDQRQRVVQPVIRHAKAARAQAPHDLGGADLRTLQAAAGGGAATIRALANAVIAAAGKRWRAHTIRRARIAAIRELHALDDRTLRDIGVSRSEIEWVVVHGRPNDNREDGTSSVASTYKCRDRSRRT